MTRLLFLLFGFLTWAAALAPAPAGAAGVSCPPAQRELPWSAGCFDGQGETRRVKPAYVRNLAPGRDGFTVLAVMPHELVAIDRGGKVVVSGIAHTGDFDFPDARAGVARHETTRTVGGRAVRQCGYFQARGFRILVPARYDACQPFGADGEALACIGCEQVCTELECQNDILVGGQGFVFDRHGRLKRRVALRGLEQACGPHTTRKIGRTSGGAKLLLCEPGPGHPFAM